MADSINWAMGQGRPVDMSFIGDLPDAYQQGAQWGRDRKLRDAFKQGLPKDEAGNTDWNEAARIIGQYDPELAYKFLASSNYDGFGTGAEKFEGQPVTVWDPAQQRYVLRRYGNRGTVWNDENATPVATEESRMLPDGSVIQYGKRQPMNPVDGGEVDFRQSPELQPNDEPMETQQAFPRGLPTNEADPQIPPPQTPQFPEFPPPSPDYLAPPDQAWAEQAVDQADAEAQPQVAQAAPNPGNPEMLYQGNPVEVEAGKAQGDIVGKARTALPSFENTLRSMVQAMDQVAKHPELESRLGRFDSVLPPMSRKSGEVQSYIDNAIGKQFTIAYEGLKGAGAITEGEGSAAKAAVSRLENRNMTKEAYKKALAEARYEIFEFYRSLRKKARVQDMDNPYRNPHQTVAPKAPEKGYYTVEEYFGEGDS